MGVACVQDIYRCDTCKSALTNTVEDANTVFLFPLAILMTEQTKCVNYEFDPQKVELQLQRKDNLETERS